MRLSRPLGDADPDEVTVGYTLAAGTATPDRDYTPGEGTLTFTRGGATEQAFDVATLEDTKHEGGETVILRLVDPVGAAPGFATQAVLNIDDDDPFDPNLLDDFETEPVQFEEEGHLALESVEVQPGDPLALPGQGAFEGLLHVETPILVDLDVDFPAAGPAVATAAATATIWSPWPSSRGRTSTPRPWTTPPSASGRRARSTATITAGPGATRPTWTATETVTSSSTSTSTTPASTATRTHAPDGKTFAGKRIVHDGRARFGRDFAMAQDWTLAEGLSFWFYGTGSGSTFQVEVKDNRRPDPGPSGWRLLWSDEFRGPAGRPPDPRLFSYDLGDGSANNIPGWGNSELQYYTDDPANAATDGAGNLVLTARAGDGSLSCYYGPCRYTSARLKTQGKREVGYGRVEARIRLPRGAGLWPAFWSMGTDLGEVGWPQAGEIDIMEWVGRLPQRGLRHHPRSRLLRRGELRRRPRISAATSPRRPTPSRWSGSPARSAGTWTASSTIGPRPPTSRPTSGSSTIRSSCC